MIWLMMVLIFQVGFILEGNMKRIFFLLIIIIGFICTANQCNKDDCNKKIIFVNNSSKEVYINGSDNIYPDTLNFSSWFPNPYNQPNLYRVKPGESSNNAAGMRKKDCIEEKVEQGRIFVYVFDAEVLANYSWGDIGKNYMVLKTYHPTIDDMEQNNWTIYFTDE